MRAQNPITVHLQGHIAVVTISNPEKLNSMRQDHYFQLGESLRNVDRTPEITITVLTGTGRFFSAGTDVSSTSPNMAHGTDIRRNMRSMYFSNLDLTHILVNFSKILIVALNGPVVGFPAALVAHADFIYAAPHTFLLTPFSLLGVAAEGAASRSFVRRLGISKANEALIMSKRIPCEELVANGFVNKVISAPSGKPDDSVGFLKRVLEEVQKRFSPIATQSNLLSIKNLIREPGRRIDSQQNCDEVFAGLEMVTTGIPGEQMRAIKEGRKRHKL
ncbi:enoyl-CoA hydratase/isomerase family protein [Aspergillus neoniger CBS 115656]|uniref:Peroxisomal d3,d2-enoyl-CoA isomerase n=1 Tax=Aspergillus neoniger (strain CBS 115656) TaxID=1448310 RepID=A0A318YJ82_ASPNB|nr:peroxisomal d3,d2-enoyl-CoA isomerase [Aspergillus neoniger CBS 115656]PYH28358.1 peroxisomal d3,d2-enoyl-CoA isomerase [Aspergillus neoniger CBS 115656]